jgi:hypothetical protein
MFRIKTVSRVNVFGFALEILNITRERRHKPEQRDRTDLLRKHVSWFGNVLAVCTAGSTVTCVIVCVALNKTILQWQEMDKLL